MHLLFEQSALPAVLLSMLFSFIILSVFLLFSFWVFSISWPFYSFCFPFSRNFGSSSIFGFSFGLWFWWVWMGGQCCGAYFTTVLYMENWCEETFGRLTLGEPDFSINDAVCLSTHPKPTMIDCLGVLGKHLFPILEEFSSTQTNVFQLSFLVTCETKKTLIFFYFIVLCSCQLIWSCYWTYTPRLMSRMAYTVL